MEPSPPQLYTTSEGLVPSIQALGFCRRYGPRSASKVLSLTIILLERRRYSPSRRVRVVLQETAKAEAAAIVINMRPISFILTKITLFSVYL